MRNKANIAVLVSGGGTNLQALLDAEDSGILSHGEIRLVISSRPDAYALERAKGHHIPTLCLAKKDFPSREALETEMIAALEQAHIDLIVLAGYMSILTERFTRRYDHRILNIHPSLIPSFCGAGFYGLKVHEAALAKGVKVTGATVHFVNEIPDGGEIVMQKAVEVREGDTPEVLQKRVMQEAEWIILPATVEKVAKEILEKEQKA